MQSKRQTTLFILAILAFLPLALNRDFNYMNELRYLSIVDESLRDGHFFAFFNQGEPYADKPPLYLWLVMLGRALFGKHLMWWLGLLSVVPALVCCWAMSKMAKGYLKGRCQTAAELMLISSALFTGMMVMARMDMMMTMWIVLAMQTFYTAYSEKKERGTWRWLFPLFVFLGVFTKGPIGILIPLIGTLAFLAVERQWRWMGRAWGWLTWGILLGLCLVWWGAVFAEAGWVYIDNLLVHQTVGRAVKSFHHAQPFWYYLKVLPLILLPWTPYIIGSLVTDRRYSTLSRFLCITALSSFIMLSCFSSKLAVYLLPLFPFIVYAAAIRLPSNQSTKWAAWCIGSVEAILALAFMASPFVEMFGIVMPINLWLPACLGAMGSILALVLAAKRRGADSISAMAATLLTVIFTLGFLVKDYNPYIGYGDLCKKAEAMAQSKGETKFYTYGLRRTENMDVYTSLPVVDLGEEGAFPQQTRGIVVVPIHDLDSIKQPITEKYISGPNAVVLLKDVEK